MRCLSAAVCVITARHVITANKTPCMNDTSGHSYERYVVMLTTALAEQVQHLDIHA